MTEPRKPINQGAKETVVDGGTIAAGANNTVADDGAAPGGGGHGETGCELEVDGTGMELEDDEPGCDDDVAMDDAGVVEDKGDGADSVRV